MKMSISRSWESLCVWLLWIIGVYLVLEIVPFLLVGLVFKKTASELAGPYLAFAVPCAIMAPLVWFLRRSERRGLEPKRLARRWGVSGVIFGTSAVVATIYCCVNLGLMDTKNALGILFGAVLLSTPIAYFTLYHTIISSRMTCSSEGSGPK